MRTEQGTPWRALRRERESEATARAWEREQYRAMQESVRRIERGLVRLSGRS